MWGRSHARQNAASHLFERPSAGQEENAEADESQGALVIVIDVAEVEPEHGGGEAHNTQIDQRTRKQAHAPPAEKDGKGSHQCVGEQIGIGSGVGRIRSAVVIRLGHGGVAPRQCNHKRDGDGDGNQTLVAVKCGDDQRDGGDGDPGPDAHAKGEEGLIGGYGDPAGKHEEDAVDGCDGADCEKDPLHRLAPGADKEGEVKDGPDKEEPPYIDVVAGMVADAEGEFRKNPGGQQQEGQDLLRLVAQ